MKLTARQQKAKEYGITDEQMDYVMKKADKACIAIVTKPFRFKTYRGYVFRHAYRQWVNDILGGIKTWAGAKEYVDNLLARKENK